MRTLTAVAAVLLISVPLSVFAEVRAITFPVAGTYSFRNDFHEPRDGGAREHLGIDIIAAKMTPVVAVTDGVITFIAIPQASWGYSITLRDSDGYSYRYLHLNNDTPGTDDGAGGESHAYAAGLHRGSTVTKGQIIGWVGDSGNAEATVSHLHFEIRAPDRTTINPYDTLFAAAGGTGSGTFTAPVVIGDEGSFEAEEQFVPVRLLQEGMIDREISTLHQELKTLGFYSGAITDTYTAVTREAVRQFQVAQKLPATGIADAGTRKAIATAIKTAPILPVPTPAPTSGLALGAEGQAVRDLQTTLKSLGYFTADVTGYFGPITRSAVIAFQIAKGIDPIGSVGPLTRAALASAGGATTPSTSSELTSDLKLGSRGDEVTKLQTLLKDAGFFHYTPSGYFGTLTQAAVIEFQKAKGIEQTGTVGPKTREALNLL